MQTIFQASASVVRLENRLRLATGFFYKNSSDELYLVTNKHVLYDKRWRSDPPKILRAYIPVWTRKGESRSTVIPVTIPLYDRKTRARKWKTPNDRKVDIAALKIDEKLEHDLKGKDPAIVEFSQKHDVLPTGCYLALGSPVVVLGFPGLEGRQFYDEFSNLPIARHATIATLPPFSFTLPSSAVHERIFKQRFFLVDGELGPGMSGSPVVSAPKSIYTKKGEPIYDDVHSYLVGILSAGEPSLKLHAVWWPELIEEATC